jgi:hypothetical protein
VKLLAALLVLLLASITPAAAQPLVPGADRPSYCRTGEPCPLPPPGPYDKGAGPYGPYYRDSGAAGPYYAPLPKAPPPSPDRRAK